MEGFAHERRGLFDGLRVPHSLNAVAIAALGLIVYVFGVWLIEALAELPGERACRLLGGMLGNLSVGLGRAGDVLAAIGGWEATWTSYPTIVWIAFLAWTSFAWALFSGSIFRIAAMKIAREEGLDFRDAVRFGVRKFGANLFSVLFVVVIVAFFYLVTNASLAGGLGRIPYVGDILLAVLFVLVLASTFFLVFAATLGILGFNLAGAAIATEDSDTFDGVSRAWNYILARPWQVILTYFATFAYLGVVLYAGNALITLSVESLSVGFWGLGEGYREVAVADLDEQRREALGIQGTKLETVYLPGKADYVEARVLGRGGERSGTLVRQGLDLALERFFQHVGRYPTEAEGLHALLERPAGVERWRGPYLTQSEPPVDAYGTPLRYRYPSETDPSEYALISAGPDNELGTADDRQIEDAAVGAGPRLDVSPVLSGWTDVAAGGIRFWINVFRVVLGAYVIAYFLSAQTVVYFLLRRDVEGDDYSEITLEEEEEEEDQPFEYGPAAAPPASPKPEGEQGGGGKTLPTVES